MADFNGSYSYSKKVAVKNSSQLISISIFPNPASSVLQVQIPSKQKGVASIVISDASGKAVYRQQVLVSEGNNARSIPVASLANGLYQITIESNGDKQTKSFLKQ
jgi:hypothetical protein